jgi:O-antigen ligase
MTSRWTPAFRRLLSLPLTWITLTALASPTLPVIAKVIVGGVFAASFWNPAEGLLVSAGLAPLGALLAAVFDVEAFRLTEAIVLAFFAGSMLRGWPEPEVVSASPSRGLAPSRRTVEAPRYATAAAWLLAAVAVASAAGVAWRFTRFPGELAEAAWPLARSYFTAFDRIGVIEAAKLSEGLGLAAATIVLFRRRPALAVQVPAVLGASALCASIASVMVLRGLGPDSLLQQQARIGWRVAAHVRDVNAAGSYFAMILCLALGMSVRERGSGRVLWLATAAACAIGLWLSRSHAALASAGIVLGLAGGWVAIARLRSALRAPALVAMLITLVAIGALRARSLARDPEFRGSNFRVQFIETSLRIVKTHPLFGIGIGRYYPDSNLFLSPQLAWTYGFENAHNNFLQTVSELGLIGFGLFAVWISGGIAVALRALALAPHDWRLLGALAGVSTLLGTCMFGHPLLVFEVGFPFWVQFGLMAALGSSTVLTHAAAPRLRSGQGGSRITDGAPARRRSALWATAASTGVVVLMSLSVSALRQSVAPLDSRAVTGFYEWQTDADGVRFCWSENWASVFVPANVARIEIPVRVPREALRAEQMGIEVSINGVSLGRFIAYEWWSAIALDLPAAIPPNDYIRVNLKMDRAWRPALVIPGSADMRAVSVQVGEYRALRTRANLRRLVHTDGHTALEFDQRQPREPAGFTLAAEALPEGLFLPLLEHDVGPVALRAQHRDRAIEPVTRHPVVPHRQAAAVVTEAAAVLHAQEDRIGRRR